VSALAAMFYARLPLVRGDDAHLPLYRVECGLRWSAVLGSSPGRPVGFQLERSFKQGAYDATAALLLIFYALIATVRLWCRPALLPLYLVAALCCSRAWRRRRPNPATSCAFPHARYRAGRPWRRGA